MEKTEHLQVAMEKFPDENQNQEIKSVFDGIGGANESGNCTGCGNNYFFAVKLAL